MAQRAKGKGGDINITTTGSLALTNGALVSTLTRGKGDGGDITLNANTLKAFNGGQVLTTSSSSGKAGDITLNVTDSITLAGSDSTYYQRLAQSPKAGINGAGPASGLFANTSEESTGQGGSLGITTGQLIVRDGAQVNVSSLGLGDAGDIEVTSRSIQLDNQGTLSATTSSGKGGNITLQNQDLILMRHNSEISTEARGSGNGGDINIIDADLIVAVPSEDSDIVANAFEGNGGNINITTQGIFGIQKRERDTLQSDITASSQLGVNGVVEINTLDIDPSQGLATLPAELVEASGLIATGCAALGENEFIFTGRGGLPPSPSDPLSSDTVWTDLRTSTQQAETRPSSESAIQPTNSTQEQLVEAQGWMINAKGEVVLTAHAPTVTPHIPWITPTQCHTPEASS